MVRTNSIDWNEQFKIRPRRNASSKHEVIKTLLVRGLIEKYRSSLIWVRIYTEYPVGHGKICDVYFENVKTKEIICYEIQKVITKDWLENTKKAYDSFEHPFFKTDWVLIKENDYSDNIIEIEDKLKEVLI